MKTCQIIAFVPLVLALGTDILAAREGGAKWKNRSLEEQVRLYIGSIDASPNRELRKTILSQNDEELKPIMEKISAEPIEHPDEDYARFEELAFLSLGLADRDFGIRLMRKVVLRHKDLPFDINLPFFRDYLERDPEGAEATFRKLAEIGNENVRGYAEGYLAEIAEKRGSGIQIDPALPNSKPPAKPEGESPIVETKSTPKSNGTSWLLIALGVVAVLGISFVLVRSRLARSGT